MRDVCTPLVGVGEKQRKWWQKLATKVGWLTELGTRLEWMGFGIDLLGKMVQVDVREVGRW